MVSPFFESVILPNVGALGRLRPDIKHAWDVNVGANWQASIYTVPSGRLAVVTWVSLMWDSGTSPTAMAIRTRNSSGTVNLSLGKIPVPVVDVPLEWSGAVFLTPGQDIRPRTWGGDGTTDLTWSYCVLELDWTDFGV